MIGSTITATNDAIGQTPGDVTQGQVKQFEHLLIVWKRVAGFGHFSQRHVQRLDGLRKCKVLPEVLSGK